MRRSGERENPDSGRIIVSERIAAKATTIRVDPVVCRWCQRTVEWVQKENPDTCIDCAMKIDREVRKGRPS